MADIPTIWVAGTSLGDWASTRAQLLATGSASADLQTAVLISLFTDATATEDDLPPDRSDDPRGWWGDPAIGSRLWLLSREKQTDTVLLVAKAYIAEALQWLIDDGVASSIDVLTEWSRPGFLGAQVTIHRASGPSVGLRFDRLWENQ